MGKFQLITKGLIKENPTFVLLLGMCPTLATTTSAINGMSMGLATMFVLILSNIVISLVAPVVPDKVRIPVYIVIIATFVTVLQLLMQVFHTGEAHIILIRQIVSPGKANLAVNHGDLPVIPVIHKQIHKRYCRIKGHTADAPLV